MGQGAPRFGSPPQGALGPGNDRISRGTRFILALMGEQHFARSISRRVEPIAAGAIACRPVNRAELQLAVLGFDAHAFQAQVGQRRMPSGRHQELVGGHGCPVERN